MTQYIAIDKDPTGTLFVVATPIGNLEDITLRALRILKEADIVACEDTRVTKKLLTHYNIDTPTLSYHSHSGDSKSEKILTLLEEGKQVALVTDAGTPGVSDPGGMLIARARERGVRIEAIPGASALTSALSIAGIPLQSFVFYGFLPQKKGRQTALKEIVEMLTEKGHPAVLFESTHRIEKLLTELVSYAPHSRVTLLKEITKMFETTLSGTPQELLLFLEESPEKKKGEFVVIISA